MALFDYKYKGKNIYTETYTERKLHGEGRGYIQRGNNMEWGEGIYTKTHMEKGGDTHVEGIQENTRTLFYFQIAEYSLF